MDELIEFPMSTRLHDIEQARRKRLHDDYYAGRITVDEFYELMHGKKEQPI